MAYIKEKFRVRSADQAKEIGKQYLLEIDLDKVIDFGLPEVDDRFSVWRVPLLSKSCERIGELVIDAITTFIDRTKTTEKEVLENRLLGRVDRRKKKKKKRRFCKVIYIKKHYWLW